MPEKENLDGLVNAGKLEIVSVDTTGGNTVYRAVDANEFQALIATKMETELNHRKGLAALYFATALGVVVLATDVAMTLHTGSGYKAPEWAIAIITSVYLGVGSNQLLAFLKAWRKK